MNLFSILLLGALVGVVAQSRVSPVADGSWCNILNVCISDFITVGAGPSGSATFATIARNLPSATQTLITDGPESPTESFSDFSQTWWWNDTQSPLWTINIPHNIHSKSIEMGNVAYRDQYWPHCKKAGGCQLYNGGVAQSCTKGWWDKWASITNNQFFSYSSMLSMFKWFENWKTPDPNNSHGHNGPFVVQAFPTEPIAGTLIKNTISSMLNIPILTDTNGPENYGVGDTARNVDTTSPYDNPIRQVAYIKAVKPILSNTLKVITSATVISLIYHPIFPKKVIGVRYFKDGDVKSVYARRAVILTAGAMETPKLAMLSGIGNCSYLSTLSIACVQNSPMVGQNLMSQSTVLLPFLKPGIIETRARGSSVMSRFRTANAIAANDPLPDGMLAVGRVDTVPGVGVVNLIIAQQNRYNFRGSILLQDNDHHTPTRSTFNMYSNITDIDALVEIFMKARQMISTIGGVDLSKGSSVPNNHDSIKNFLLTSADGANSNYHVHGTMSMGSVVDTNFEVIGINGLYVCDPSVTPHQEDAHAASMTATQIGTMCGARISQLFA